MRRLGKRLAFTMSLAIIIGPIPRLMAEHLEGSPRTRQETVRPKIEYSVEPQDDSPLGVTALRATENGKTYSLIGGSKEMCLQIEDQRDFDGNGFIDALVRNTACGGNCCKDGFFFVSALGDGRFERTLA
jgi:hypothetical protein